MSIKDIVAGEPLDTDQVSGAAKQIRDFKAAVQNCFTNLEGQIVNTSGTSPNKAEWDALFAAVEDLTGNAGVGTVPYGAIMMFNSTTPPAGWALCDGGSYTGSQGPVNTPDLVGRFIIGQVNGDPEYSFGMTGGTLTTDNGGSGTVNATINIPDHVITADNIPEHEHKVFVAGAGSNVTAPGSGFAGAMAQSHPSNDDRKYVLSEAAGDPDQGRTSKAGGVPVPDPLTHASEDITIDGIEHTHTYQPPYYAAVYVMYIGVAA